MALEVFELGKHPVRLPARVKSPIFGRFTLNRQKKSHRNFTIEGANRSQEAHTFLVGDH